MKSTENGTHFDLLVIGFGKAGKTLAMERAEAGDRVALTDRALSAAVRVDEEPSAS